MSPSRRGGHRSVLLPVAAATLLVTGVGCVGVALAGQADPPRPVPAISSPAPTVQDNAAGTRSERPLRKAPERKAAKAGTKKGAGHRADRQVETAPPVAVSIPSLQLETALVPLGLTSSGQIEAPKDYDRAGWFQEGTRPGDSGAAVIAGHVDSKTGPAVFYHLSTLRPGAEVIVERKDGSAATFRVDRLATYPKDDFPTVEVYATNGRELRLITCGGAFSEGEYEDNVVVFASLVGT